ncbi:MAG: outer membrane assembly protein BamE [Burkholderiales bacterium PBB4]|nr:MAG: outer membrane assembly protein BamE [Burkholderiales bacterium PBB4]
MSAYLPSRLSFTLIAALGVALSGCSSFDAASTKAIGVITPYKMDIVQGNVVTREQLALIKPGLTRLQVRDIMGTALLTSVFHADRWDYIFTLKSQSAKNQQRKVAVFFKGDAVERTESDELPSEIEFVATLQSWVPAGTKPPSLEASEDVLKKFPPPAKPVAADQNLPPARLSYPPLEAPTK